MFADSALFDQRRVAAWLACAFRNRSHQSDQFAGAAIRFLAEPVQDRGGAFDATAGGRWPRRSAAASRSADSPSHWTAAAISASSSGRGHAQHAALGALQIVTQLQRRLQPCAVGLQGLDVTAECLGGGQAGQGPQRMLHRRAAGAGQHVLARLGQRVVGVAVVDQLEMRGDRGLQREAAQQRLAEGVDGADPHAAGQVQHLGEQGPGGMAGGFGGLDVQPGQFGGQPVGRHGDPAAERALQAQRHLRGGGLGEGQALDAFRGGAGQHQAQQPVGQQLGLARPGRGGDERRNGGIGGGELLAVGALAGGFGRDGFGEETRHGWQDNWFRHPVYAFLRSVEAGGCLFSPESCLRVCRPDLIRYYCAVLLPFDDRAIRGPNLSLCRNLVRRSYWPCARPPRQPRAQAC